MEKIFPMGKAGFIEMHMGIYRPGKEEKASGIEDIPPRRRTCFGV